MPFSSSWKAVAAFESNEEAVVGRSQLIANGVPARILSSPFESAISTAFQLLVPHERLAEASSILRSEPFTMTEADPKYCPDLCPNCGAPRYVPGATGLSAIAERFLPGPAVLHTLRCEACGFDPGW
jgi:hypothetical protein